MKVIRRTYRRDHDHIKIEHKGELDQMSAWSTWTTAQLRSITEYAERWHVETGCEVVIELWDEDDEPNQGATLYLDFGREYVEQIDSFPVRADGERGMSEGA